MNSIRTLVPIAIMIVLCGCNRKWQRIPATAPSGPLIVVTIDMSKTGGPSIGGPLFYHDGSNPNPDKIGSMTQKKTIDGSDYLGTFVYRTSQTPGSAPPAQEALLDASAHREKGLVLVFVRNTIPIGLAAKCPDGGKPSLIVKQDDRGEFTVIVDQREMKDMIELPPGQYRIEIRRNNPPVASSPA